MLGEVHLVLLPFLLASLGVVLAADLVLMTLTRDPLKEGFAFLAYPLTGLYLIVSPFASLFLIAVLVTRVAQVRLLSSDLPTWSLVVALIGLALPTAVSFWLKNMPFRQAQRTEV